MQRELIESYLDGINDSLVTTGKDKWFDISNRGNNQNEDSEK